MTRLLRRRRATTADRATRKGVSLLPPDGDLDTFVATVGASRGRPITVMEYPLGAAAASGLWLSTPDTDYLVVSSGAALSRRTAIICHELAHMLLGHHADADATDALSAIAPDIAPEVRGRFLARTAYGAHTECDAEEVGTSLATELLRRQRHPRWSGDRVGRRLR